ncbi:MAG: adenine phosphoribosyltransferase [Promethearchaeota archaeon]
MVKLIDHIRNVPDWPKPGIQFKDITTLLVDPVPFKESVKQLLKKLKGKKFDKVVGIESRGFIWGAVLAHELGIGFVPIRKPGKLPYETVSEEYELEYGTDKIEMHVDAVEKGEKVLVFDDLLATGGTAGAAAKLVEKVGGVVEAIAFVIELTGSLHGRDKLEKYDVVSLVEIPVEE